MGLANFKGNITHHLRPFSSTCHPPTPGVPICLKDDFTHELDEMVELDIITKVREGVVGIADDIVVFGKTTEEHNENLHGMMERCQNTGLKLNPEKCFIKQKLIKFYGVSVLKQMTKPKDRR